MSTTRAARSRSRLDRPVFIVAPPGSGTAALFETLSQAANVWTVGGDGLALLDGIGALQAGQRAFESNRLLAGDAAPDVVRELEARILERLRDRDGKPPPAGAGGLRLVEMTPRNSLRVPFLGHAFPDALFVYLFCDPRATLAGALEAWRSRRFVTYLELPGWDGPPWSLLLVPGWRELSGLPLPRIVARQWQISTRCLLDDLDELPPDRWCVASYDALVEHPQQELERLCRFLDLDASGLAASLPALPHALVPEDPAQREKDAADIDELLPELREVMERAGALFARPPKLVRPAPGPPAAAKAEAPKQSGPASGQQLRSVHTPSFPQLLAELGSSLLVSTYQSGHVIALRAASGALNTHFRGFRSPMGLALGPSALAIGTERQVWLYRNVPAAAVQLPPAGQHDACFLPQSAHVTGDVRVHELAFAGEELWLVNTRFSCLCTLDARHSFVPRWRPPFVSALAPDDRCHLNGLAIVDGRPRYVTAHGRTDASDGWRERKARGGVIVEVATGEIVAAGLSMPHSPRWHQGRLYVLESGAGTLARVDLERGRLETIARLPGFTRGLACLGPLAFVGLSQVRESGFRGIPLTEGDEPRYCGVWVVHLETGAVVGFVRFEEAVQEIFDVQLLPGLRFPELAEPDSDLIASTFVLPDEALSDVPRP